MTPVKPDTKSALEALDCAKRYEYLRCGDNPLAEWVRDFEQTIRAALQADTLEGLLAKVLAREGSIEISLKHYPRSGNYHAQISGFYMGSDNRGQSTSPTTAIEAALGGKHE